MRLGVSWSCAGEYNIPPTPSVFGEVFGFLVCCYLLLLLLLLFSANLLWPYPLLSLEAKVHINKIVITTVLDPKTTATVTTVARNKVSVTISGGLETSCSNERKKDDYLLSVAWPLQFPIVSQQKVAARSGLRIGGSGNKGLVIEGCSGSYARDHEVRTQ